MNRLVSMIAALGLAGPAVASPLDDFTAFYVFGDSLSDFGLAYEATNDLPELIEPIPPSPPYAKRFSNGPVWNEYVASSHFASEPFFSYAVGGAQANTNLDAVPDLNYQKGWFFGQDPLRVFDLVPFTLDEARGDPGDRPLAALWFGANDVLRAIGDADVFDVADDAVDEIGDAISDFAAGGISDFLIFNLPDLAKTPRYVFQRPDEAAEATTASLYFNQALDAELGMFGGSGINITQIDIFDGFNSILGDLGSLGFLDTLVPCITGDPTDPSNVCSDGLQRVFFDDIHISTRTHALVAGLVEDAYAPAPIPLPASLPLALGGIAGLALVAGRGRRARR